MEDVKYKPFVKLKASFIALFAALIMCAGIALVQAPEKAYAADSKYLAEITIENYGTVTVELDRNAAPVTVDNFVALAKKGFYNGLTFHRFADFCVQGGDPKGDGTGGSDKTIKGEFKKNGWTKNNISHKRGVISMARAKDYNSGSSQFFITTKDSTWLDGEYAAFGRVVSGMDVIDTMVANTYAYNERPIFGAPKISSVKIVTSNPATGWVKSGNRWWYKYSAAQQKANGGKAYPRNETIVINGKWYRFDSKGWMKTNWQKVSGKWYYYGSDGAMKTGWKKIKGKWYYMASNGVMQTGKKTIGGSTYYLAGSGAMKTGWNKESGKWYYYDPVKGGAMATATVFNTKNKWYMVDSDGSMITGLSPTELDLGGGVKAKLYFDPKSGAMQSGWKKISGKWYYFKKGSYGLAPMQKNKWISGKYWVGSDGVMATKSWVDNGRYYVDSNGKWVKNARPVS